MRGESPGGRERRERGDRGDRGEPGRQPRVEEPGVADRADFDPEYDPSSPVPCEVCGGEMYYTAACKLKCPRCGYMRDCSDP